MTINTKHTTERVIYIQLLPRKVRDSGMQVEIEGREFHKY